MLLKIVASLDHYKARVEKGLVAKMRSTARNKGGDGDVIAYSSALMTRER